MKPTLPNFLPALGSKLTSFKNLSALVVVLLFSGGVWGQSTANYAFTTNTTGSLVLDANSNAIDMTTGTTSLIAASIDDGASSLTNLNLGVGNTFEFYFMGTKYTNFGVSSNGIMTMGVIPSTTLYALPNTTVPTISAFANDIRTGTDGNVIAKVVGTAPNRTLVLQWTNIMIRYLSTAATGTGSWQVRLYESTGAIEYVYDAMTTNTATPTVYYVGLSNNTTVNNVVTVNTTANTASTSATVTSNSYTASSTITQLNSASNGSRRIYNFTPTSTTAPTALTFSNIGSGAMRLNWTDNSSDELGFIIERSTDNSTFTTLATLAANTATYNAINLAPNTTYYFKVSPLREAKGTALSGNQSTSVAPTYASVISIDGNTAVPGTSYPTITEAVADLGGTIANAITLELASTYNAANETYPIQLPYVAGSSATNTLTIVQANGVSGKVIESSNSSSTFIIDEGDYWIIDGRSGGTGSTKDLVISNTNVAGTAIQLINDASYNTLKYCTFKGVNTSATSGVVVIGSTTTTAATGNDYNTITYCDVRDGATTPTNCIYSAGPSVLGNNNTAISYNNVFNFFSNTVVDQRGILLAAGSFDCTINNNSVFQTSTKTFTVTGAPAIIGIHVNNTTGYNNTISNNYIGGTAPLADTTSGYLGGSTGRMTYTGTATTYTFIGIRISTSGTLATCPVSYNTIKNISVTSATTSSTNALISVSSGSVNINGNTIGDLDANNSVVFITSGTGATFNGILTGSGTPGDMNITNNSIGGISISGTGTVDLYGIYAQGANANSGSNIITSNTIGSTTVANSLTNSTNKRVMGIYCTAVSLNNTINNNIITNLSSTNTTTTLPANRVFGIYTLSSAGIAGGVNNINGNSVKNLTTSSALARSGAGFLISTTSVIGIYASATTTTSNVSSNTVSGLLNTNGTLDTSVLGINAAGSATTYYNTVEKNNVYNIGLSTNSVSATNLPMIIGIWISQGLSTVKNNMIRLGSNVDGTSYTGGAGIYGLYDSTGDITKGTFSAYHNTIYIGGTNATSALNTFAFYSGNTGSRDIRNNIFFNARSNSSGGSGKHYLIWINNLSTTLTLFNYNDYLASGTGGVFGFYNSGGDRTDLTAWRTATGQDANSINSDPCLNDPTAATPNLHLTTCSSAGSPAEAAGTLIASVTDDFDGETRSLLSPTDMGADAGNYGNSGVDMKAAALVSPTTSGCKTATETVSVSVTNMSSTAIDLSVNNVTVAVTATGGYSSSVVLNTGTLAAGLSQTVTMPATIDLTANGTYTFNASTSVTGDVNFANDALAATSVIIFGGTYTVGTVGNYATIAAAVTAYNAAACISSNVVFSLTDAAYDIGTTALTINQNANSGAYTLTIKPAVGVSPTITGAVASSAIFNIRAKNVIIDGSNTVGGTTRNLTITNTSITSPIVILIGNSGTSTGTALTDVTLKNAILINGVNTSTAVIVANNLAAAGYFNNITIQNNNVQKAYIGIYALATVATGNGSGLLITGNDLNATSPNALSYTGIFVQGVDGATVSNNNIANITSSTLSPYGVVFNTGTNSGSISGNTISTLSYTGTATGVFAPKGIVISSGSTATAISVSNNTISGLTSSGKDTTSGIYTTSVNHTIFNNKISNIKNTNTGGYYANGIFLASTSTTAAISVYNNFIFDIAGYGWSTATDNGHGIVLYSGGGYNLYNNTINMNTNQTYATSFSSAIYIYSTLATAASVNIRNNIFANTQTGGAPVANRYAIYCAAANTIFGTINHNVYYSAGTNLGYLGSARINLAGIVSGFGGNANSISVSPTFTSATDLHLTAVATASGNAALKAGTYLSTVLTDYDGETRNVTIPTIGADEIFINGFWTGTSSTAYETSGNWDDNAVPSSGANITIPTGVTNKPVLASDKTIGTLSLGTSTTLSIGSNTLTINGAVSGSGTLTGSSTSNLTIGGTAGTLNFTSGSRTLKDLTLNSSATATLGTALDITAGTTSGTVTVGTSATLTTGGNLTLKSDANGTARVGNSAGAITGNATVERYIPLGKRAFRLLSPAVTTSNNISNNWQQQTHITGGATGGFDITETNNPSMYTYDNQAAQGVSGWTPIANTDATNLTVGVGYRVLIRGDRTPTNISAASADAMNVAITLSATGTLKIGTVALSSSSTPSINNTANSVTNDYSLVGNPYQSPVDWNAVTRSGIDATYYAWDPNMGTSGVQRGRYVSYNVSSGNSVLDGPGTSNVGQYIQPGQAFFVKNTVSGTAGTLTFEESHKATTNANVFRTATTPTLGVALYDPNELALGGYPIDAMKAVFSSDYSNELGLGDATKLEAAGENIAWFRNNTKLAIDAAAPVTSTDELAMKTIRLEANKNYTFKIQTTNFDTALTPYLVDNFLNTQTEISTSQAFLASFATTSNVASNSENRFKVVFNSSALNNEEWNSKSLRIYPNPVVDNQFTIGVSSSITDKVAITIYNIIGQSVYKVSATPINNSILVQPNVELKAGVYMVEMTNNGKTNTQKIIVK